MDEVAHDISPAQLLQAYSLGIFPMAPEADSDELRWYDPTLRGIIPLDAIHLPRSLAKVLRKETFRVSVNTAFADVMDGCATAGMGPGGIEDRSADTWISPRIKTLYRALHAQGHAHSVEVWQNDVLVGGLYGVTVGRAFCGESMFARVTNASRVALVHTLARLIRQGFMLCDTQYLTDHLAQFGAIEIPRSDYQRQLAAALESSTTFYSESVSSGTGSSVFAGTDVTGGVVAAGLVGAGAGASASGFTGCSQSTTVTS